MVSTIEQRQTEPKTANGHKLSAVEAKELVTLENTINKHFETFKEAGSALRTIRDKRLYRETHASFEDYCRFKWSMSKTQANRLIAAAQVVENLKKIAPSEVTEHLSESAIRPLAGLDAAQQKKVFAKVMKTAPSQAGITAKLMGQVAREVAPSAFKPKEVTRRHDGADLVRKTEVVEAIAEWQREQTEKGKFDKLKPAAVVRAIRAVILALS